MTEQSVGGIRDVLSSRSVRLPTVVIWNVKQVLLSLSTRWLSA